MTLDARRAAEAHVFVASLDAPMVEGDDRHHLERVLRLRPGARVTVSDGRSRFRSTIWAPHLPGSVEPAGPVLVDDGVEVTPAAVWLAAVKADRVEWAVQKLTELGLARIGVFTADRSVVRWDDARRAKALLRLTRIAREASMQSRRCTLPHVEVAPSLAEALAVGSDAGLGVVRAEPGGTSGTPVARTVLVGPEGGWSDEEQALVPDTWGLGPTILRAETAAIVAGVRLTGT